MSVMNSFDKARRKIQEKPAGIFLAAALGLSGCGGAHYQGDRDHLDTARTIDSVIEDYLQSDEAYVHAYSRTIYSTFDDVIVIHDGSGGYVDPLMLQYQLWAEQGKQIVVDGSVRSADAFGSFSEMLAGRTCYTENAVFAPHAASYEGDENGENRVHDAYSTEILAEQLIAPLEHEFRNSPFFNEWEAVAHIDYDRLQQIWPAGECSPAMKAYAARTPNF